MYMLKVLLVVKVDIALLLPGVAGALFAQNQAGLRLSAPRPCGGDKQRSFTRGALGLRS